MRLRERSLRLRKVMQSVTNKIRPFIPAVMFPVKVSFAISELTALCIMLRIPYHRVYVTEAAAYSA